MKEEGVNDNSMLRIAEEKEEEEHARLVAAGCLRGRLMFCHGPLQFWVSAPDDEQLYLALMCYKHNASLHHLTCHNDGAKIATRDLH